MIEICCSVGVFLHTVMCVCVCVCVCACVHACVCVCARARLPLLLFIAYSISSCRNIILFLYGQRQLMHHKENIARANS